MNNPPTWWPPRSRQSARPTARCSWWCPPEGTRSKVRYWKTGFYHIAHGAGVPIVLSYMDYSRKVSGLGPVFHPTGDIERDMATIKAFYAPFKGKNPDQSGQ